MGGSGRAGFFANEYWERGSVYEPNVLYHDGKWKMWYVAGANQDDYLVQGYAESPNGRTDWSAHRTVFSAEEKVFDFCVVPAPGGGFDAVLARVNVGKGDLPKTGLWWCHTTEPSPDISQWSEPVRIAEAGPWKPVLVYGEDLRKMFVFHDNTYPNTSGVGMPMHFTIDCLEMERPGSRPSPDGAGFGRNIKGSKPDRHEGDITASH